MTFLMLLLKPRDYKQCHKTVSEKWMIHAYITCLDLKANLDALAREGTFQ